MTCETVTRLYLDSIAAIPLSDTAALAQLECNPAWMLVDHPAASRFRQAHSIRKFRQSQTIWQSADWQHPAIYRALRLDKTDPAAFYAAWPFRLAKLDNSHVIVAAPVPFLSKDEPETIIVWHPNSGQFHRLGDAQAQLICPDDMPDETTVFGDFFQFARAWIEARAIYFHRRQDQLGNQWVHPLQEPKDAHLPGILAIGDIRQCRIPRDLPPVLNAIGIDASHLKNALFRAASIPRINDKTSRIAA